MAKDKEVVLIDSSTNEYEINAYAIKYDSKTKRFFKGFAPKVGNSALISAGVFAGLSVATVLTGGIAGIGAGLVAGAVGASVGVGTAIQTAYSGIVYGRNASATRFKNLGIGGKENNVGTIGIIEEYEARAHKYTLLLDKLDKEAEQTGSKHPRKIKLEDGATYSRRDLKKRIKESEDIAYHGLKYILDQGIYISSQINTFSNKTNPTERERANLEKYWDVMDRIGDCVKNVASKRLNFNPYKGLIVDAIGQGCLLGDYNQNNEIRRVATVNDNEMALNLYFEMYERELLERNQVVTPVEPQIDRREHEYIKAQNEQLQRDNESLREANSDLGDELAKTQAKYKRNVTTAWNKRAENKTLKKENQQTSQQLSEAQAKNKRQAMMLQNLKALNKSLTSKVASLEDDVERAVSGWYESEEELKAFKSQTEKDIDTALRKAAQLIADEKEKVKAMGEANDELEAEFEKLEAEMEQLEQLNAKLTVDADRFKNHAQKAETRNAIIQGKYEKSVKRGVEQRAKAKYFKDRAEKAEEAVKATYEGRVEVEQQNQYWQSRAESAEDTAKTLYSNQTRLERQNKILKKQVSEVGNSTVKYIKENATLKDEKREAEETLAKTQKTLKNVQEGRKKDKEKAQRQKETDNQLIEELGWDLHKTKRQLEDLTSERDTYKETVEDLREEKRKLEKQLQVAQDEKDYTQAWVDYHQDNFERGGKLHKLGELLMRVDAHVECTKEMQKENYDKDAIEELSSILDIIRKKNPDEMTKEDIVASGKTLTKAYNIYGSRLQSVTSKEINKVIDKMYSRNIFTLK